MNKSSSAERQPLKIVDATLGWKANAKASSSFEAPFDLDISCYILDKNGDVDRISPADKKVSDCGSVVHKGDDLKGGDGIEANETIHVELDRIPEDVVSLTFLVEIHEAKKRGNQTFGQIERSFVRIVNCETNDEIARLDLSKDAKDSKAVTFGVLARDESGQWVFRSGDEQQRA